MSVPGNAEVWGSPHALHVHSNKKWIKNYNRMDFKVDRKHFCYVIHYHEDHFIIKLIFRIFDNFSLVTFMI